MINLKEKLVYIGKEYRCIDLKRYDDAIAFYLDARDFPEKHPELVKEFYENYILDVIAQSYKIYSLRKDGIRSSEWRDWLFNKIFEGE